MHLSSTRLIIKQGRSRSLTSPSCEVNLGLHGKEGESKNHPCSHSNGNQHLGHLVRGANGSCGTRVLLRTDFAYFDITYQPALAQSEEPQEDEIVRTFPPDGLDADQGKHHDDGEDQGNPEQGGVLLGELGHRWDEEESDEAHRDNKLHSEDRVHLQMRSLLMNIVDGTTDLPDEVESDGLVGEAAPHPSIATLFPSLCVGIRLEHFV